MNCKRRRRLNLEPLAARCLLAAVEIPDDLTGVAQSSVSVPVNIDNSVGIRAAEIRLQYNTQLLDLTQSDVTAGTVWAGNSDTQVTANVDDATGTVVVFVSSATDLPSSAGDLISMQFTISGSAAAGATAVFDLTSVVLNEGSVSVDPAPVAGADETDGLLTIVAGGSSSVSGFVYADANGNNIPDTGEAISGVTITIVNSTSNQQQQAVTDENGRYAFSNLDAGTYQLSEHQPVAYLEGGVNELGITLTVGQSLENQNFRESGLLPQYIYNRLLTTLTQPVGSTAWTEQIAQINADARAGTVAATSSPVASTSVASLQTSTSAGEGEQIAANQFDTSATTLTTNSNAEAESVSSVVSTEDVVIPAVAPVQAAAAPVQRDVDQDHDAVDAIYAGGELF